MKVARKMCHMMFLRNPGRPSMTIVSRGQNERLAPCVGKTLRMVARAATLYRGAELAKRGWRAAVPRAEASVNWALMRPMLAPSGPRVPTTTRTPRQVRDRGARSGGISHAGRYSETSAVIGAA